MRFGLLLVALASISGCKTWPFQRERAPADRDVITPPQTITPFWPNDPKPNPDAPPIDWSSKKQDFNINAPSLVAPGQDLSIRLDVTNRSAVTVRHSVPANVQILRTDPPARLSGSELIWDLLPSPDARQSMTVVYRPSSPGAIALRAEAVGADGSRRDAQATTQVGVGRLALQVNGPNDAKPGDRVSYDVRLVNSGQSPVGHVVLRAEFDSGLDHESGYRQLEIPIETLQPGESKTVQLPLTVRNGGRLRTIVSAKADGGVTTTDERLLEVHETRIQMGIKGPSQVMLQRPATWIVNMQNNGTMPTRNMQVQVMLPAEMKFSSVSAGGRATNGLVTWTLEALKPGELRAVELTAMPITPVSKTTLAATLVADGASELRADQTIEIIGLPLLKISLSDNEDRVEVGKRVVYTAEVRNAGSMPLEDVQVTGTLSPSLRPIFGFGPTMAQVDGAKIVFGAIAVLEPGRSATIRFEAEAISPGDARVTVEARSKNVPTPVLVDEATRVIATGP